jgi:integrase
LGWTRTGCWLNQYVLRELEVAGIQTRREVEGLNGQRRVACVKGFHSFRHTAITMALAAGKTSAQVRRLAGHATEAMQRRYTHLDADDAGDAAEAIGKFW